MAKRKKKGTACTKPKKQTIEKVSLTEEQEKELQDKISELKMCLCESFIHALITADISDRAKESLNDIQEMLKNKVDLFEPNIFKYISLAYEKINSAQHYFYKVTNKVTEIVVKEDGDNRLESIQEQSDVACFFIAKFSTILQAVQFDATQLKVVWNGLLSLANKIGIEIDEEEPDWASLEDVCKTALYNNKKIENE